jgi:hypothetical protein
MKVCNTQTSYKFVVLRCFIVVLRRVSFSHCRHININPVFLLTTSHIWLFATLLSEARFIIYIFNPENFCQLSTTADTFLDELLEELFETRNGETEDNNSTKWLFVLSYWNVWNSTRSLICSSYCTAVGLFKINRYRPYRGLYPNTNKQFESLIYNKQFES